MTTWTKQKLGDVCELQQGLAINKKSKHYLVPESSLPLLRITDLINHKQTQFVDESIPKQFIADNNSLIYSRTGQVGLVFKGQVGVVHNNCFKIIPSVKLDINYLYYYLQQPAVIETANQMASKSAQPDLTHPMFKSLSLSLPDLPTQQKIASILSAYDELIENNEKRIKILEEMAQRLYTEWFVHFRYPGHENVPLVDSHTSFGKIPMGWKISEMQQVCSVVDCLHTKKPLQTTEAKNILLQLNNILDNGLIDSSDLYHINETDYKNWTKNIELTKGDCIVTNVGRIAAVAQIPSSFKAAPGRNMTALRPEKISPEYLIQYLLSEHMAIEVAQKTDSGAIMGSMNVRSIKVLQVLLPDKKTLSIYSNVNGNLRNQMNTLNTANSSLQKIRKILIPQLISGKREVK